MAGTAGGGFAVAARSRRHNLGGAEPEGTGTDPANREDLHTLVSGEQGGDPLDPRSMPSC